MEVLYLILSFFILKTNAIAIKGPSMTRYDPCGLGAIYFDKLFNSLWKGVVHLSMYDNLQYAELSLTFEKPFKIHWEAQNGTLLIKSDEREFFYKSIGMPPDRISFYLSPIENVVDVPIVAQFKLNNVTLCNDALKATEQTIESLDVSVTSATSRQLCGRRALAHAEILKVNTISKAGDWPWHVALFLKTSQDINLTMYNCGGSVISRTAVLTAGHCLFIGNNQVETSTIIIAAGVNNVKDINQTGLQILPALQVILHPSFRYEQTTADLAIVRVNKFVYTEFVQPICIWGPVYDKESLFESTAIVTGFGRTEQNQLSDMLRSAYTTVQKDSTCISVAPELYSSLLNEFTFCAGLGPDAGINQLNGDSGGGLVLPIMQVDHKMSWFLRGVLSKCFVPAGAKSCDPGYYDIYVDVGPHYGWIYHNSGLYYTSNIVT
ncbi:unnamed protein product [Leptidea sinapis]|uniref:Peptidase S1 domain-containing protein n=1 Tax=Leptidea sinapis TaxID=189913 RepID=A0A5E4PQZ0_9NEOP|nr:unnamed protein product [Leptidea sinapis]